MGSEVLLSTKEKSIEMRLIRWVKHSQIDADTIFMPFARQILEALSSSTLVFVMDGSQAGRNCVVLMVGVLYKKRALPIAWVVYKGKKGHTTVERHIQAVENMLRKLNDFFWAEVWGMVEDGHLGEAPELTIKAVFDMVALPGYYRLIAQALYYLYL